MIFKVHTHLASLSISSATSAALHRASTGFWQPFLPVSHYTILKALAVVTSPPRSRAWLTFDLILWRGLFERSSVVVWEFEFEFASVGGMNSVGDQLRTTTGSFQNQTTLATSVSGGSKTPQKRKRGLSAVLQDCTNEPLQKRSSKARAESTIHGILTPTPHGNPSAAGIASVAAKQQARASVPEEPQASGSKTAPPTLCSVFKKSRNAFDTGAGMLMSYVQRNASYEVQKAVAISIMATAMTVWMQN